jgi:CRP-like cAMP-binding protein
MFNQLLDRFPADSLAFLRPHLAAVTLGSGTVLHAPGRVDHHVYFPTTAVVRLVHVPEPGRTMVVGLIDRTGMTGAGAVLGHDGGALASEVMVSGQALRLAAAHVRGEFDRSAAVRQRLLGWLQVELTQVVRAASCQHFHSAGQRLCLRLLQLTQGSGHPDIAATQQQLSDLVGVRREAMNQLVGELQSQGLIEHRRGHVRVVDAPGLARGACHCLGLWKNALDRCAPDPS